MTEETSPHCPGPLAGLRVLELADETGQFCGKLLGDLGADVVKIEPPRWRALRRIGPFLDDIPHPDRSLSFWYYNTSKRGITLDLETADGRGCSGVWRRRRTSFSKPSGRASWRPWGSVTRGCASTTPGWSCAR